MAEPTADDRCKCGFRAPELGPHPACPTHAELEPPPAVGLIHVAGIFVQVDARLRQRCAWCGAVLLDYDLDRIAVPEGQGGPGTWPTGALIEVDGPMSTVVPRADEDPLPEGTCTAIDHEVTGRRAADA